MKRLMTWLNRRKRFLALAGLATALTSLKPGVILAATDTFTSTITQTSTASPTPSVTPTRTPIQTFYPTPINRDVDTICRYLDKAFPQAQAVMVAYSTTTLTMVPTPKGYPSGQLGLVARLAYYKAAWGQWVTVVPTPARAATPVTESTLNRLRYYVLAMPTAQFATWPTGTPTCTVTKTATPTFTATPTNTPTPTFTATSTVTPTRTATP